MVQCSVLHANSRLIKLFFFKYPKAWRGSAEKPLPDLWNSRAELTPPPQAAPRWPKSAGRSCMCVKTTAGIARILQINSRKSRDFWAPNENTRRKKWLIF